MLRRRYSDLWSQVPMGLWVTLLWKVHGASLATLLMGKGIFTIFLVCQHAAHGHHSHSLEGVARAYRILLNVKRICSLDTFTATVKHRRVIWPRDWQWGVIRGWLFKSKKVIKAGDRSLVLSLEKNEHKSESQRLLPGVGQVMGELTCPPTAHMSWLRDKVVGMVLRGKKNSVQFWALLSSCCLNWSLFPSLPHLGPDQSILQWRCSSSALEIPGRIGQIPETSCWHSSQWHSGRHSGPNPWLDRLCWPLCFFESPSRQEAHS